MIQNEYWKDLDERLTILKREGFVKLPSIDFIDLEETAHEITEEMRCKTFLELGRHHASFLKSLGTEENLAPKLYEYAVKEFGYRGSSSDAYHIARRVEPGNSHEMYRAHFDSHLFTLVLPIKIPTAPQGGTAGELIYFPGCRPNPKSEWLNFIDKLTFKRFASRSGIDTFATKHSMREEDFLDYSPMLFMGRTTLHTNKAVSQHCASYRLTLLAHYFDPSPKVSVGGFLRLIRRR